jgi:hypothetical protein
MIDQFVGQGRPAAAQDLAPSGRAERRAGRRVRGQPGDRGQEGIRVTGRHQIPGHAVLDQV